MARYLHVWGSWLVREPVLWICRFNRVDLIGQVVLLPKSQGLLVRASSIDIVLFQKIDQSCWRVSLTFAASDVVDGQARVPGFERDVSRFSTLLAGLTTDSEAG